MGEAHAIAQQSARDRVFAKLVNGGQALPGRKSDDLLTPRVEIGVCRDQQRADVCAYERCERGLKFLVGARVGDQDALIDTACRLLDLLALPPGRLKLSTTPSATGSPPIPNTIGIVDVARFAASAEGSPPAVVSTATRRLTNSAAMADRRS